MLTETEMLAITTELARVKSRGDSVAALAIYHPEIELASPGFASVSRGRAEVGRSLAVFFALFPDYRVTLTNHACRGDMMLATAEVSFTPAIPGVSCPHLTVPVFIEFHFRDGLISREVFGLEMSVVCQRAGITEQQWQAAVSHAALTVINEEKTAC